MADRRMISAAVVGSDAFVDLSFQAQALYIQLILESDNFGFCSSVKKVMRYIGVNDDALEELENAFFVIRFDSGVFVIRHWFAQNYGGDFAKNDRTIKTEFVRELAQLTADFDGSYVWLDSERNPDGFQPDSEWSVSHSHSSESKVRAIKYISKALGVVSESVSESVSEKRLTPDVDCGVLDEPAPPPPPPSPASEQLVYTDQITGKGYTLREYMEQCKGIWKITDVTWKIVNIYRAKGLTDKLIRFAFDQTVNASPEKEDAYFSMVLKDYHQAGFTTVEQAMAREAMRNKTGKEG